MNPIRKILNQYRAIGILEVPEIAGMLDCSQRRIHYVLEGEAELKADELRALQQYFGAMGRLELAYLSIPDKYGICLRGSGKINGSLLDEMRDAIKAMDQIDDFAEERRIDDALEAVDALRSVTNRYEAELKNMKG